MNFAEALDAVAEGAKVTKEEWGNESICILLDGDMLSIRKVNGKVAPLLVSRGDMIGEDWVVVRDM